MAAMQGMIAEGAVNTEVIAKDSVKYADALLNALELENGR